MLDDLVESELKGDFQNNRELFISAAYHGSFKDAKSSISCLNKYYLHIAAIEKVDQLPKELSGALNCLVAQDGRSTSQISRSINKSYDIVSHIIQGARKTISPTILSQLERELKVPSGVLTSRSLIVNPRRSPAFCPQDRFPEEMQGKKFTTERGAVRLILPDDFPEKSIHEQDQLLNSAIRAIRNKEHLDSYGQRLSKNRDLWYVLKENNLSDTLRLEINDIIRMKRTVGTMGKPNAARRWKDETVDRWTKSMFSFFGWCLLSSFISVL